MNAVIYARYSSDKQTEQSIEGQLRECYAYAERNNLNIVGEYIDRATSGTNANRPEFQRMIADSSKRQFNYVIVYKLDRFARNRYDSAIYKRKLKLNNVRVISVTENIGTGSESAILEAVLEAMAEEYSHQLSENTKRGLQESALKCNTIGGSTPLGYTVVDKKYVVDEKNAPFVKYIFKAYAAGDSKTKILEDITQKGCHKKDGKPLTYNTITNILNNPKYIGEYYFKGELISKNACPQIIEKEIFNRCQERLQASKRAMGHKKEDVDFILFGKLFCGHCGANMAGNSGTSRSGERHYYYTCSTHKNRKRLGKDCDKKSEKKGFIEWYIVEQTVDYVLSPERIEYIAERVVKKYNDEFGDNAIENLEKRLKRIDRELDEAVDALIKTKTQAAIDRINERLEVLDLEKKDTETTLAKTKMLSGDRIKKEEVVKWLEQFCNGDPLDVEFQKKIIDAFVNAIYLFDDKLIIYYNVKGGKQVTYIDMLAHLDELDELTEKYNCSSSLYNGEPEREIHKSVSLFFDI